VPAEARLQAAAEGGGLRDRSAVYFHRQAEASGKSGSVELQGQRYEGLTVFFTSLLASAGGSVLDDTGTKVSLAEKPTIAALSLMKRLASSPSMDKGLDTAQEDQARLAFETGKPIFMINYSFVWPSAQVNAPEVAANMAYARWPKVYAEKPSRVTLGGLNLAVGAFTRYPNYAFETIECLASAASQIRTAEKGGLPPTLEYVFDLPEVRSRFPFSDVLRDTLKDCRITPANTSI
jgi:multiple sugar transport system substrate-binding protein